MPAGRPRRVLLAAAAALAVVAAGSGYAVIRGGSATRDYPAASLAGTLFAGPAGPKAQPGQGISQPMRRVASFGGTVVAVGSQTGGDIPRAQFFVSRDDGTTWRLAAVTAPGGGAPAPGHAAQLITHGRTGWLATGPDGIWTSTSGRSWTLTSTSGITPADAGDQTSVLISTGRGYLAAGQNTAEGTAVIWTSADGLHWQRMAAPQLGMPSGSGVVTDITGAAAGGGILLSGHIATTTAQSHGTGSQTVVTRTPAVWLSTDGGVTWTLAPVPVSHGATNGLAGIAADGTGFVAVRPGNVPAGPNAQPDGVVYASANGTSWRYVSTLTSASGVQIGMVAGGPGGFAALGRGPGGYMAGFLSADGLSWRSGISFGPAPASVTGATVTAAGTVLVTGARGAAGSQRPYLALAQPGQSARAVNVSAVPGAKVPQLSLNAVAVYRNQRVAVGEAGGLPAVWSAAGRSWSPVSWSPVSWSPVSGSSSPGSGAGPPSASAPSASHSSTSGSSTSGLPASGSSTSGLPASGSASPAAPPSGSPSPAASASPAASGTGSPSPAASASPAASGTGPPSPAASASTSAAASVPSATSGGPDVSAAADGRRLTSVVHGPAGWLATGQGVSGQVQQPIIATSANGTVWHLVVGTAPAGSQTVAVQAAAGAAGYVIAGTVTTSAGTFPAAWWSSDLRSWHSAGGPASGGADRNDPGEMLGVTAGSAGFVAVGQEGISPAVWTSRNGRAWTMVTLKVPVGTASAELQRVAVSGQHAVALGQEIWPSGARTAFAEVSADGGRTWQPVSLPSPHGDAAVTAVTLLSGGFTAVGTDGTPGGRDVVVWTSADGSGWTVQAPNGTGLSGPGVQQITGLAASGGTLTGVGFTAAEAAEQPTVWNVPAG